MNCGPKYSACYNLSSLQMTMRTSSKLLNGSPVGYSTKQIILDYKYFANNLRHLHSFFWWFH
ncbi:hypothetical protein TorRG33x02_007390 [Trema orientale]|uniref:Uncharacterized protein n=1 Tax=Trema orientale TaxID=63057 RepID=A0A2P5G0G5_TREOI|nr:hypothetical protein TorRG33x02_007390 [Trema orientale]